MDKLWFEQPWTCGHNDPVFVNADMQKCAVCSALRGDPEFFVPSPPPPKEVIPMCGFIVDNYTNEICGCVLPCSVHR